MASTDDPHVRFELRSTAMERHAEYSHWEDTKQVAREICEFDQSERERLVAFLRDPWDFRDPDAARGRTDAFAQTLADGAKDASQLAERIDDAEVRELDSLPGRVTSSPSQLLWAVGTARPALGAGVVVPVESGPTTGRLRHKPVGRSGVQQYGQTRELLSGLREGDARARRQLADHLSGGTWFDDPGGEGEMLSDLVADEDPGVVAISLTTVLRLAELNPRAPGWAGPARATP